MPYQNRKGLCLALGCERVRSGVLVQLLLPLPRFATASFSQDSVCDCWIRPVGAGARTSIQLPMFRVPLALSGGCPLWQNHVEMPQAMGMPHEMPQPLARQLYCR